MTLESTLLWHSHDSSTAARAPARSVYRLDWRAIPPTSSVSCGLPPIPRSTDADNRRGDFRHRVVPFDPRRKLTATGERHRHKLATAGSSADRLDAWKRRFGTGQVAHNLLNFKGRNIMYRTLSMVHRRQVLN
jgi:hypothetical protein